MVERICPACQGDNAMDALECASCGASLAAQPLAKRAETGLSRFTPALPVRWQRAGKAVALGAVAVAVEVGAAWLQHRSSSKPAPLARRDHVEPARSRRTGFVARQRVWETFENGQLRQRVVEQTLWRLPDEQ